MSARKQLTKRQVTEVFVRDGGRDRYDGGWLKFPGLQLLEEFIQGYPYPSQYRFSIDHVHPVCRGGTDHLDNLVCTSMWNNRRKRSRTLEELDWYLGTRGDMNSDDGGIAEFVERVPYEMNNLTTAQWSRINRWYQAARWAQNTWFEPDDGKPGRPILREDYGYWRQPTPLTDWWG
jgi:hypothetical protein